MTISKSSSKPNFNISITMKPRLCSYHCVPHSVTIEHIPKCFTKEKVSIIIDSYELLICHIAMTVITTLAHYR